MKQNLIREKRKSTIVGACRQCVFKYLLKYRIFNKYKLLEYRLKSLTLYLE